jgi:hypothetical protein
MEFHKLREKFLVESGLMGKVICITFTIPEERTLKIEIECYPLDRPALTVARVKKIFDCKKVITDPRYKHQRHQRFLVFYATFSAKVIVE